MNDWEITDTTEDDDNLSEETMDLLDEAANEYSEHDWGTSRRNRKSLNYDTTPRAARKEKSWSKDKVATWDDVTETEEEGEVFNWDDLENFSKGKESGQAKVSEEGEHYIFKDGERVTVYNKVRKEVLYVTEEGIKRFTEALKGRRWGIFSIMIDMFGRDELRKLLVNYSEFNHSLWSEAVKNVAKIRQDNNGRLV